MSRTRHAAWNVATALLFTAVTMLVGLAATPVLLRELGSPRLGAVRAATELYGYLTLMELGLGGTVGPLLAGARGRGDDHALRHTMAAGTRAFLVLVGPILLVGLLLGRVLDLLVPVGPVLRADLHAGWCVGLVGWLTLPLVPMRALMEADQRGYRVNLLITAQALLVVGTAVVAARAGWGITGQMFAQAAGTIALALAMTGDVARHHPGLLPAIVATRPDAATRRALWSLSAPTLAFNVCGRLAVLTDSLVISAILGPGLVVPLFVTQRLATLAQSQLQVVGNASWAALAEMHGRGERALFNRRLVELTGLVTVVGVAALAPIIAYNRQFVLLWMKDPKLYAGEAVTLAAAASALLQALFSLWMWCFSGTGRIRRIVAPVAAMAAVNLGLSIALTRRLGLIGPLLGTVVAYATVYAATIPYRLCRDFGTPVVALFRAVAVPLAWGLPYAVALRGFARTHRPEDWATLVAAVAGPLAPRLGTLIAWLGLAAEMGAAALAFLLLAGRFLLSPTDRDLWLARLADALPGRRRDAS